ncbi:MAG: NFACT family protein [Oscillospiraceae bacterium]|nr:NFACT family protein [Oscillospiraceae bacterium]
MPLDAVTLMAIRSELSERILESKVDKVFQPEKDEIILSLRGRNGGGRLLLSANQQHARIQLLTEQRENPQSPPMFCMLLRKHIGGGIIREISQPHLERSIEFVLDCTDEMGAGVKRKLVLELIGRQSNLLLLDEDGRIIDGLRRIDGDLESGKRQLLPGMFYRPPQPQDKLSFLECGGDKLRTLIGEAAGEARADKWILDKFYGLSPLICREIVFLAAGDVSARFEELDREKLASLFLGLAEAVKNGEFTPCMLTKDTQPVDFSFMRISQYENVYGAEIYGSFSELTQDYFQKREKNERLHSRSSDIIKSISTALDRTRRKLELQRVELEAAGDREGLRRSGDLLMANLHVIKRGQKTAVLQNFYDENGGDIEIKLSEKLSPQENAAKYYKDYTRMKNAEKMLSALVDAGEKEEEYLESVLEEITKAENVRDILDIRAELSETGYLKTQQKHRDKGKKQNMQAARTFLSSGGYTILAGRNNLQNDTLTLKEAHKYDIWLHSQKAHGAHVIIKCGGGEPDDATYTEAAQIAAYYSELRGGENVPVDYTRVRNVKKPAGSRPGMVVYDPYFTAYVTPSEELVEKLRV